MKFPIFFSVLLCLFPLLSSHTISKDIQEFIAKGCYEDGILAELDDAIEAALKESGGARLDFNFMIPEQETSDLMAYPVAVASNPDKLELLVLKGGAKLEWLDEIGEGRTILHFPAMEKAIKDANLVMFEKILELGGTMRPCNRHINLVYELVKRSVSSAFPSLPIQLIRLLECALKQKENRVLLDTTDYPFGLTCMGYVFQYGTKGSRETSLYLLRLMLNSGASPFTARKHADTPLKILVSWSNEYLVAEAMSIIFLEHPEIDPFHQAVNEALYYDEGPEFVEALAVITEARLKRRNAILRAMMLPEIASVLESDQLRDPLVGLIGTYLLQLYLDV